MADRRVRVILEAVTSQFQSGMGQARGSMDRFQNGVLKNQAAWLKFGAIMTAAGAVTTRALLGMANDSAKFNAEITKLTTQVGIARTEALALGAAAAGLGIAAGRGPQEMAEALFFVTSAGLRGSEALQVLNASAKASAIGLGETKVIADLVTSAVNAYGSETLSASQATDILIGAVREGKAEAPALAGALGKVLPIASEMGVKFDEVGAAVAAMTRTGTDAATATTQLRAMLQSLLNPARGVEQAMGELGFSSQQLRDVIREDGLWAALMMMRDAVGDNEAALGRLFPNQRALLGFLDLTGANATDNARIFDSLADSTGNLADGFAEWATTTQAAQQRFSAAMEAARISVGGDLEPAMRAMLDTGTGLALMFTELPDPVRQAGTSLASVAGVLATLAGAGALGIVGFAHLRQSMQAMNISAVSLLRFAVHPLVLGFGALALAILGAAKQKAEMRMRAETLRTILGDEADAILRSVDAYQQLSDVQRRQLGEDLLREHQNLLPVLEQTGASIDDIVRAKLGDAEATARLMGVIDEHTKVTEIQGQGIERRTGVGQDLLKLLQEELGVTEEAARIAEVLGEAYGTTGDASDELGDESAELAGELDALAGEMGEVASETEMATEALREYLDEQRAATDPVFNLTQSLSDQADAQDAVNEARDKFGKGSPEHLQALEDLARKNLDVESAFAAVAEHGIAPMIAALDQMVAQGNLTRGEADLLIEKFKAAEEAGEDFAGEYVAELLAEVDQAKIADAEREMKEAARERIAKVLPNLDGRRAGDVNRNLNRIADPRRSTYRPQVDSGMRATARTRLNALAATRRPTYRPQVDSHSRSRVNSSLNSLAGTRHATIRVGYAVSGGIPAGLTRGHTGGMVTPTGIRRMHDGGTVGGDGASLFGRLAPDEVPAILQTRERVLSREENTALERLVRMVGNTATAGPRFHDGGTVTSGGSGGFGPIELRLVVTGSGSRAHEIQKDIRDGVIRLQVNGQPVRVG